MKSLFSILFLLLIIQGKTQDSTIIYYNDDWKVIEQEKDAKFYRIETTYSKSNTICVKDFWMTGELQMIGNYVNNTEKSSRNGGFIYYNQDGSIDWQVDYLQGKKHGIEKKWYGVDTLLSEESFVYGKLEGESLWYYESGQLMLQEYFKDGKEIGIGVSWFEDGNIESIAKFNLAGVDSVYIWYNNGQKELEGVLFDSEVEYIQYGNYWDANGKKIVSNGEGYLIVEYNNFLWKGPIVNGLYNGTWYKYKKSKGDTWEDISIGKMKFQKGDFKTGYLYFQGNKIKINGDWTISPKFPGNKKALSIYIADFLGGCRSEIIENIVYVEFVVLDDGRISDVKIISGKTSECQKKNIYQMFKNMPNWVPGIQMGNFVNVRYTVPINYRLD